jgi:serine/threonine protein kinase
MRTADVTLQTLQPGAVFAVDYRIVARLDEGGMGLLYRAEQLSTGEERALKVLKPSLLADGISRDRFTQEATIGANIPSDHIVKVIDAGIDDDTGIPWIAMELLRGDNLLRVVRAKGPLPRRDVLEIFAQLSHALAAAHKAGVVHRDLKPENIFIARTNRRDAESTVKLLDFGIAKMLQTYETSVTATAIVGSPLWMAPEQVKLGKIRSSTDVWALGLLAFWMLTGKYYWRAAQERDIGQAEALLHEKMYGPLEAASKRAASYGVAEKLPDGFDDWFKKCVARDPEDRYPDAERAFEALREVLTRRSPRMNVHVRGALLGASVAGLVLAGGWAVLVRQDPEIDSASSNPANQQHVDSRANGPLVTDVFIAEVDATPLRSNGVSDGGTEPHPTEPLAVVRANDGDGGAHGATDHLPSSANPPSARVANNGEPHGAHAPPNAPAPRGRVTPQASGYVFRAQSEHGAMRCTDRTRPHPWEVTPDWAAQLRDQLRQRETRLSMTRRVAGASPSEEMTAQIAREAQQLERDRAAALTQVERAIPGE